MKEALFYKHNDNKSVTCFLCPHRCTIPESKRGICKVRENRDGKLYSLVYGKLISEAIDPIEKKPLYHFYPASLSYSIATVGCNLRCFNCQNYEISQMPKNKDLIYGEQTKPEDVISSAKKYDCLSISYTYTEPTIFFEYAFDTSIIAHEKNIKNVFVTNGYITEEALVKISPFLDGVNIDLKSMSDKFYREICGAELQHVLDSIKLYKRLGIWIEITTLIIPSKNDSEKELNEIADFISDIGKEIPWHVSQFYPTYKMNDLPRTPTTTLKKARTIGYDAGLKYVYTGNIPGDEGESTYCYNCGEILIKRYGFQLATIKIKNGKCFRCNTKIDGVGL
ncbi:MAG: AmmeMemoRadiSam system radical SAM enzyme [Candidatus Bathyarchaeota archaeon]|nr:AmmeMemoRadiSam system radical SAM enzyme [Candidatus Bathyarchaeota archaeon]